MRLIEAGVLAERPANGSARRARTESGRRSEPLITAGALAEPLILPVIAAILLLASCEAAPRPPERVPTADDFADFLSWQRTPLATTDTFPHAIYANGAAQAGEPYALGTAFVNAEESGPHQTWFLHGMAFRGGDFNAGHATGWEFFGLYMDERSVVHVIWRGDHPPLGAGYVEADSGEHLDAGPMGFMTGDCRGCHADPMPVIPY